MTDVHTREQRSRNMSAIRSKNTKPEVRVRSILHCLGYRFRLHCKNLPGKPDIVLPKHRTVIFVHGCFWHLHDCKFGHVVPATRPDFWAAKRAGTVKRDQKNISLLKEQGLRVVVIWECETSDPELLRQSMALLLSCSGSLNV